MSLSLLLSRHCHCRVIIVVASLLLRRHRHCVVGIIIVSSASLSRSLSLLSCCCYCCHIVVIVAVSLWTCQDAERISEQGALTTWGVQHALLERLCLARHRRPQLSRRHRDVRHQHAPRQRAL